MKIGIVGAGALGLTYAAALAHVHDVIVLVRRPAAAAALKHDGIAVLRGDAPTTQEREDAPGAGAREATSATNARVSVQATVDPHALADRDAVVVAVKAYALAGAVAPLRGVLRPSALIASVQNGLDAADVIRGALPGARVVAGSTTQGAARVDDTTVRLANDGRTAFARDDGAAPTSDDLVAAFRSAGLEARVTGNVERVLWRKLIVNAAINPLGALAGSPNGALVDDPDLNPLFRTLAREAAAVAAADGVDAADAVEFAEAAARATPANRSSMLQDLDAGRPTEIDAISGAIVRRAHEHGIGVPLTETILRLVRGRERVFARRDAALHQRATR